ncbi:hypothetical protein G4974_14380 [[Ruminococcus] gnavus]|jgi:DNA polymerase III gamma/tau subunit|uniref:Uncharacterized protein n=2 Tax=Mediterraneibacter gnavus TaxID=33038 RepID=A0AAJ1EQS8_MEDGN|nr:hypothetical protein [Mediterraneibacter gnavus]MCC3678145.1 hypothetical protein [[Clostridium] nexile]MCB5493852.1 hypothetical protein [Mediterraneibacter gnavus]MCB5593337.1 hypothetical protein [Mediterraneibacter gnavus]MCB5605967.1 hypothetical protein [Mediterraneibacter gnavus]MCB5654163.1 hypothetical protein [Mediterraneibacter gnavus]
MKEILKKYKRQVQIAGGICLIGVLGIGGYVAANQDTAVQTQTEMKKETKSSDQKIAKNDTKDAALEKKTDTKKETVKKEDTKSDKAVEQKETTAKKSESADNKSTEKTNKKEEAKTEKESEKTDSKPSDQPESKPEQKPESKPEQKPSKPESKPEQKPSQPESKPGKPQHTHTWQEKTHTVNHPEVGHNEQYVVKEAWTETVTEDVYDPWECCNVCGADITANVDEHIKQHMMNGEGGRWHTEYYKTVTRTVEHPAEYGTRYVVDTPAWTETVSDGFFCTGCGAKK